MSDPLQAIKAGFSGGSLGLPPSLDTGVVGKLLGVSSDIMGKLSTDFKAAFPTSLDGLDKKILELMKLKPQEMMKKIQEIMDQTYKAFEGIAKK